MSANAPGQTSRKIGVLVLAFVALFGVMAALPHTPWRVEAPGPVVSGIPADAPVATLTLATGEVEIALRRDLAPRHVERIIELANSGFYDGIVFHRVIPGFMAQTGDPQGTGMGGSDLPDLEAEFTNTNFTRGTVGMARSANPDSANSQFFIVTADSPHLNGQYTLFGNVISGMDHIDAIKQGDVRSNGTVQNPDAMISLRIAQPE
ncbi:peptidylprolyl isomerase [Pelagibacterium sediminicola]|uniref:peptidylprolyl isomerase n=1 Tax=Pelagibacterium sediminicola TaxID=2248761 RepID=UPI000E31DF92|nr:peptidylprolyl isomerase [Pelagibacterium sediminicola]